jgi:hypothetical protein
MGNIWSGRAGIAQLVEHHLAKVDVAGSNPVSRSIPLFRSMDPAASPSGKATVCKTVIPSSNLGAASILLPSAMALAALPASRTSFRTASVARFPAVESRPPSGAARGSRWQRLAVHEVFLLLC